MRAGLTILHRYVGLAIATFLFVAGLTGAIIAWHDALDDLLNPALRPPSASGSLLPAADLARAVEARDPRARVTYLPVPSAGAEPFSVFVQPRIEPQTGHLQALDYNQVFLDPATGAELGRRTWGQAWPITRETLIPFLYKLHYTLHLPAIWGEERIGLWLMGAVAAVCCLDSFVGLYLTFPRRPQEGRTQAKTSEATKTWWRRWAPAWKIKTGASAFRLVFDIHRAFGLWTWLLLILVAFTGFSLALNQEIVRPLLAAVAKVTPSPLDATRALSRQIEPSLSFADVMYKARTEAGRRDATYPLAAMSYDAERGIYGAYFHRMDEDTGPGGVEPFTLYVDGRTGRLLGDRRPWRGTAADIFLQAQFPLHSGRILGVFGRILVSIIGLAVAALSVSGVLLWWRKRAARAARRRSDIAAVAHV